MGFVFLAKIFDSFFEFDTHMLIKSTFYCESNNYISWLVALCHHEDKFGAKQVSICDSGFCSCRK